MIFNNILFNNVVLLTSYVSIVGIWELLLTCPYEDNYQQASSRHHLLKKNDVVHPSCVIFLGIGLHFFNEYRCDICVWVEEITSKSYIHFPNLCDNYRSIWKTTSTFPLLSLIY